MHDRIISMGGFEPMKLVLTLTLFIEVPVPSQESEWSVFVLGVSILPLSTVLIYMYLILEMLQKCSIFINIIQLDMNSCVNKSK